MCSAHESVLSLTGVNVQETLVSSDEISICLSYHAAYPYSQGCLNNIPRMMVVIATVSKVDAWYSLEFEFSIKGSAIARIVASS